MEQLYQAHGVNQAALMEVLMAALMAAVMFAQMVLKFAYLLMAVTLIMFQQLV